MGFLSELVWSTLELVCTRIGYAMSIISESEAPSDLASLVSDMLARLCMLSGLVSYSLESSV